ncbi:Ulp1 protease family, C-terminal catalytic domain [Sesbania bispinosa]|nr:Ulp1 protease family, C-terminal catalytic domain [Sesbania bispinosa]
MALQRAFTHGPTTHVFNGYGELLDTYIQANQSTIVEGKTNKGIHEQPGEDEYILECPWEIFILTTRMQECLLTVCRDYGVFRPVYKKLNEHVTNGFRYYKYEVNVHLHALPNENNFNGRYACTEDFAREDATRVALSHFLPIIGKDVWDLHYTRSRELEKILASQKAEIEIQKAEISLLHEKLRLQISHRLIKLERTTSKILTWLESSTTTGIKKDGTRGKNGHGPSSCPPRTNAIRIDLSDYEDLDDYSDEEEADVLMDVSSEDDIKMKRGKRIKREPKNSPPKMKKRSRWRPRKKQVSISNHKRSLDRPTLDEKKKNHEEKSSGIMKKLFKSPSTSGTKKVNRVVSSQTESNAQILESNKLMNATARGKTTQDNPDNPQKDDSTSMGKVDQKVVRTRFPLSAEMGLSTDEVQVATYIFGLHVDLSEVVFKIGVTRATIKEFECFYPGRPIEIDEDILGGLSKENIARLYIMEWMNPFTCLKYIYVPIKEDNGHVYLMVVSMEEQTIYHMDSSPDGARMKDRRDNIKKPSEILVYLMVSEWFSISYVNSPNNIDVWDIKGITPPQAGSHGLCLAHCSNDSALWVLQWMAMDFAFQPNVHGLVNENVVRIKTTLTLLLGSHNELRKNLEARAEVYYHTQMDTAVEK